MMNFEKYTNSSKKIINSAQNLALGKKHQKISPIHIISELSLIHISEPTRPY